MEYTQQLLLLTQQRSTWPWPISLYVEECILWNMWVKNYSCLAKLAVYFSMINPYPSLSTAVAIPADAVSLIFLLYSKYLSNVVGFWLGVTFYGALLLSGLCGPLGLCTCAFWPHDIHNRFYETNDYLTFPTFWPPKLFPSAPVQRMLPLGFSLHSSHIRRTSLGDCEARSEMLT